MHTATPDRSSLAKAGKVRTAVFSLIPVLLLLLVTEAVLRLGAFRFEVTAIEVEHSGTFTARMFRSHLESEHFVADPVTFWKPRPSKSPFNPQGYRGDELPAEKAAGELRILAVGDSNTLGHLASWVNEIPDAAGEGGLAGRRVSVVNAGVYGYTSYQGKLHLGRFLGYRPDVVLISFGGNDATRGDIADKDYVPYIPHPIYDFFDHRVALVDLMEYLSVRWTVARYGRPEAPPPGPPLSRVSVADYEANLVEMIAQARAAGARPVLMTRPLVYDYHEPESTDPLKAYYDATLAVAASSGVALIDIDEIANHSWVLFADHSHFNALGHRLIGGYVVGELERILDGQADQPPPRFRPRTTDERAMHIVGRVVSGWRSLAENVAKLRRHPMIARVRPIYKSDFSQDAGGWHIVQRPRKKFKSRVPLLKDGALCFTDSPRTVEMVQEELGLAKDRAHFVWIEANTRSDVALKISWRDSAAPEFDAEKAVETVFFHRQGAPSIRFFHTMASGTDALRINVTPMRWEGDVCLERIYIAELAFR